MSKWDPCDDYSSSDCRSVNRHVQASIMLLSIMEGADLDLNNTLMASSTKTTTTSAGTKTTLSASSISASDDYEKDLQLAAELGRCLLERNQELQSYIGALQKQIDDEQCDIKLLHAKLESTREQLETKCKQTEVLDATNIDLERELAEQRQENERNRQRIKELADSYEKTRKQYLDVENDYERFRLKQSSAQLFPKQFKSAENSPSTVIPAGKRRARSHSFDLQSTLTTRSSTDVSPSSNLFDISSASIFKTHLSDFKSRLHSLTGTCSTLNEKLHRSDQEKRYLIERITQLERQRRDDTDAMQNELNLCRKLLEKSSHDTTRVMLSNIYSPPEHDVSLYDEVLLDNKQSNNKSSSSYQPTNYKDLFARVYDKLKMTEHC